MSTSAGRIDDRIERDPGGRWPLTGTVARSRRLVRDEAGRELRSELGRARDYLAGLADAARESTRRLSANGQTNAARYTALAADRIERLAGRLDDIDLDLVLSGLGIFARRQPAAFVASMFVLGVAGGWALTRHDDGESPSFHQMWSSHAAQ